MTVQYAQIYSRAASLKTEFGEKLARKYFGDDAINALPRLVRGKNAGKIKDHEVEWRKVHAGGWLKLEQRVERRVGKIIEISLVKREWRGEPQILKTIYPQEGE